MSLTLLPAVDVRDGKAVRLRQGESGSETDYGSPLEAARTWVESGAEWIHLVDLDAAFGTGNNRDQLRAIVKELGDKVNIEMSGGVRDDASLDAALEAGAARVNIGTAALENPDWTASVIKKYGDRVAVGVSGGKDSMVLLLALNCLRQYYPEPFELEAVTIELGFEGMDFTPVRELCEKLDIPYTCVKTDIKEIVFDVRKEDNPCSLCAKMRRGALNNVLRERNLNKLALGHHFDDAVETYMMSLLFEGRISCFQPVTFLDRSGVTQIRPLIYAGEQKITNLARELNVPIVENPCPEDKGSKRYEIKQLLKTMSVQYPDMKSKIFGAMQRLPLKGWGKIER